MYVIIPSLSVSIPRVANFLAKAGGKGIAPCSNLLRAYIKLKLFFILVEK